MWATNKIIEEYQIKGWGSGYFDINQKGNVIIRPDQNSHSYDLLELVQSIILRGMEAPILLRFDGIIRHRINHVKQSFDLAIKEYDYQNKYQFIFPVKVNPQRHIIDVIRQSGKDKRLGLEVGSKPELIAVLSINDTRDALLLCNGYKDKEYIELALLASKVGRRPIIIIEQFRELENVLVCSQKIGVEAEIGFRMKISTKGSGRWESSGGELAKFGLTTHEISLAMEQLINANKAHWLKLLHFHIGSQVTTIASVKKALREATRMYTELAKIAPSLCFFDAGGGLGVDYNGSRTTLDSSMNYTIEEYAKDVVFAIGKACSDDSIPHPTIITESGRAIVAHSSILITEVVDVEYSLDPVAELPLPPSDHEFLLEICELYESITKENYHEVLHDALDLKNIILEHFIQGNLELIEKGYADRIYSYLIAKIYSISKGSDFIPEDVAKLDKNLLDNYFCNFSVFQSIPDSWAINQLFPIMPIHRLNEEPTRRGIIADLTCDSDGKVDQFVHQGKVEHYIKLHELKKDPYYLGIFLVGAYQEVLGGLHNLFGDTNAVHIDFDASGELVLSHFIDGDTIREVLSYTQYDCDGLMGQLRFSIEDSLKEGRISTKDAAILKKRFKEALDSYTYLVV